MTLIVSTQPQQRREPIQRVAPEVGYELPSYADDMNRWVRADAQTTVQPELKIVNNGVHRD